MARRSKERLLPEPVAASAATGLHEESDPLSGSSDAVRANLARWALRLVRGEWLDPSVAPEARRFLPMLLIGIYEADKAGRKLSKREASALMGADAAATGAKYIGIAEEAGLVAVDRKPPEDRRKDFVRPTQRLKTILDREVSELIGQVAPLARQGESGREERHEEGREGLSAPRSQTVVSGRFRPSQRTAIHLLWLAKQQRAFAAGPRANLSVEDNFRELINNTADVNHPDALHLAWLREQLQVANEEGAKFGDWLVRLLAKALALEKDIGETTGPKVVQESVILFSKGQRYEAEKDAKKAIEAYREALLLDPSFKDAQEALRRLGVLHRPQLKVEKVSSSGSKSAGVSKSTHKAERK